MSIYISSVHIHSNVQNLVKGMKYTLLGYYINEDGSCCEWRSPSPRDSPGISPPLLRSRFKKLLQAVQVATRCDGEHCRTVLWCGTSATCSGSFFPCVLNVLTCNHESECLLWGHFAPWTSVVNSNRSRYHGNGITVLDWWSLLVCVWCIWFVSSTRTLAWLYRAESVTW